MQPEDVVAWVEDISLNRTDGSSRRALQSAVAPVSAVVLQIPVDSHEDAQQALESIAPVLQDTVLLSTLITSGDAGASSLWVGPHDASVTFSTVNPYLSVGAGDGGDQRDTGTDDDGPEVSDASIAIFAVGAAVVLAVAAASYCLCCRRRQGAERGSPAQEKASAAGTGSVDTGTNATRVGEMV